MANSPHQHLSKQEIESRLQQAHEGYMELSDCKIADVEFLKLDCTIEARLASFEKCQFADGVISGSEFQDATFTASTFRRLSIRKSVWHGTELENCVFEDVDLTKAEFIDAKLTNCVFRNVKMTAVLMVESSLRDCVFENVETGGANISGNTERNVRWQVTQDVKESGIRYYLAGERPIKSNVDPDGSFGVYAMNWHTGAMELNMSYLTAVTEGADNLDEVDEQTFHQRLTEIRKQRGLPHPQ